MLRYGQTVQVVLELSVRRLPSPVVCQELLLNSLASPISTYHIA